MMIEITIIQTPVFKQTLMNTLFNFNKNRPPLRVSDLLNQFDNKSNERISINIDDPIK